MLTILTLQVGFIGALFTSDVSFLRSSEESLFYVFLSQIRDLKPEDVILDSDEEVTSWTLRQLEVPEQMASDWSFVTVRSSRELFDQKKGKPSEYAILLSKIHQAGAREVVLTQDLTWPDAEELELRTLDGALRPFRDVLLPIALTEVPQPSDSPSWIAGSLIPPKVVRGDSSGLPLMNEVAVPPSVTSREGVNFAFPDFGSRDLQYRAPGRLPVLTRWHESYLPSWSLGLARRMEGLTADELIIEPGRHIRMGADGPVIPIDQFGRVKFDELAETKVNTEVLEATDFFPLNEEEMPVLKNGVVLLDESSEKAAEKSLQLVAAADWLRRFPRPTHEEHFQRLALKWEILIYLEIALVAVFALYLKPFPQLVLWALLCFALYFVSVGLLNWKGLWTPFLPQILAMVMSWCLVGYLQQIAPVRLKKADKKKKKVKVS